MGGEARQAAEVHLAARQAQGCTLRQAGGRESRQEQQGAEPGRTEQAREQLEAARLGYAGAEWPVQYLPGKAQLDRLLERERAATAVAAPPRGELT